MPIKKRNTLLTTVVYPRVNLSQSLEIVEFAKSLMLSMNSCGMRLVQFASLSWFFKSRRNCFFLMTLLPAIFW